MAQPLTDAINALTRYANEVTGQSDPDLSSAVRTLCDGYGGGGYSLEDIASGAEPSGVFDITGLNFARDSAFAGCKNITEVKGKTSVLTGYCFQYCRGIEKIHVELTGNSVSSNYFNGCTKLKEAVYLTNTQYNTAIAVFNGCTSLECADLRLHTLGTNFFYNCGKCSLLIIRNTDAICNLNSTGILSMTPFKSSGTGGTLYVPQDLISSYQSASNWSTILGYANNQILPIEGSIYETQYADGTPIE